jgi:drug/metabolite transporter (DMT)-like permease
VSNRSDLIPSVVLAVGATLWGLYWIPVRGIQQAGIPAFWTGPVIFGASTILFIPLMLVRYRQFVAHWRHSLIPGTDVVRAILLFYMSPLWSTLLGILVLKERLTGNRVLALLLAFCGLYIVLVVESGLPVPRNTGDWFALMSGLCWSIATVKLFQDGARYMIEKVTIFVSCALVVSLLLLFWHQGSLDGMPPPSSLHAGWYWIAIVALMMLPITYMTIWPATLLSPGRVGMLLMAEVLVGVASAAMLTDERFGLRELAGAVLIISAGVVEVMRPQKIAPVAESSPES